MSIGISEPALCRRASARRADNFKYRKAEPLGENRDRRLPGTECGFLFQGMAPFQQLLILRGRFPKKKEKIGKEGS